MIELSAEAKALRDEYNRAYRAEHKPEKLIANKKWRDAHREQINADRRKARAKKKKEAKSSKAREYHANYWERKASKSVITLELSETTPTTKDTPATEHTLDPTPTPASIHQGTIRQFVDDRLITNTTEHTSNATLTEAFNEWSSSTMSTTKFALDFKSEAKRLGLTQTRTKKGMQWNGVRLREVASTSDRD